MIPTNSKSTKSMPNSADRPVDRETQKAITALSALKLELKHSGLLNKPQVQALFRQLAEFVATRSQSLDNGTTNAAIASPSVEELQHLLETIKAGNTMIHRSGDEMSSVWSSAIDAKKKLEQLQESCQNAKKSLSLMKHVTTQTQLLALNASLEASRAGEYGRSFSQVTDELRSLTRQLAEVMRDIEKLTEHFQSETRGVANALNTEVQQIEACSNLVKQVQQQLADVVNATEHTIGNCQGRPA